jgi:hypothetical protein
MEFQTLRGLDGVIFWASEGTIANGSRPRLEHRPVVATCLIQAGGIAVEQPRSRGHLMIGAPAISARSSSHGSSCHCDQCVRCLGECCTAGRDLIEGPRQSNGHTERAPNHAAVLLITSGETYGGFGEPHQRGSRALLEHATLTSQFWLSSHVLVNSERALSAMVQWSNGPMHCVALPALDPHPRAALVARIPAAKAQSAQNSHILCVRSGPQWVTH